MSNKFEMTRGLNRDHFQRQTGKTSKLFQNSLRTEPCNINLALPLQHSTLKTCITVTPKHLRCPYLLEEGCRCKCVRKLGLKKWYHTKDRKLIALEWGVVRLSVRWGEVTVTLAVVKWSDSDNEVVVMVVISVYKFLHLLRFISVSVVALPGSLMKVSVENNG